MASLVFSTDVVCLCGLTNGSFGESGVTKAEIINQHTSSQDFTPLKVSEENMEQRVEFSYVFIYVSPCLEPVLHFNLLFRFNVFYSSSCLEVSS